MTDAQDETPFSDGSVGGAQRPRDEPPGQPRLVSRRTQPQAGRVGSIELLGAGSVAQLGWMPYIARSSISLR